MRLPPGNLASYAALTAAGDAPVRPRCAGASRAPVLAFPVNAATYAAQAAPRVGSEFPLSLWIRVRRDMLARVVAVSGHRGPGALKPLRQSSRQAPF